MNIQYAEKQGSGSVARIQRIILLQDTVKSKMWLPLKLRFEQDIILKEATVYLEPFSSFSSLSSFSLLTSSSAFESLNETTLVKPGG